MHYVAEDWAGAPSMNGKPNAILSNFMAPEKLVLKIGAQVMLIKNMDATLVNGTVGKVVAFGSAPSADEDDEDAVKEEGGPRKKVKVVGELVPVIEWRTPGGIERKAMEREEFKTEDQQGKMLARRRQVSFGIGSWDSFTVGRLIKFPLFLLQYPIILFVFFSFFSR